MKNIESSELLLEGYMKNPEHIVTTKLQDNKEENPVARRKRLHESSKDQRKVISIKDVNLIQKKIQPFKPLGRIRANELIPTAAESGQYLFSSN